MPASDTTYYLLAAAMVIALALFLLVDPNVTSLHRLYRDRLSKAFLFNPRFEDKHGDRVAISPKLHGIDPNFCPYPIVNAALNIGGSAFANKRGRNADFFEFTPEYTGSEATGWVGTSDIETVEPKLDLGTAMAISGAAVSPNMGSATIKPLVPTLALLNIRLGYWLPNPRHLMSRMRRLIPTGAYLYREVVSNLGEDSYTVYLTDGGNIENLGVHALLRRHCKLIVAVDAEADPALTFGAFLKLQRYARIDFGALLDLPWQAIRDHSLAVNKAVAAKEPMPRSGPHIAIGTIRYGPSKEGILVYVKSSLTGDEADYIIDYKMRNPNFPHETTGDQFFGEEQLEVYRALGFHVMRLFLENKVPVVAHAKPGEMPDVARLRLIGEVRRLLGLPEDSAPVPA